jgi:protease-4
MRRFWIGFFVVIGIIAAIAVLSLVGVAVTVAKLGGTKPALAGAIVLTADLNGGLTDGPGEDALSRVLFGTKTTLRDFVEALDRAGDDPRVKSLYLRLGDDSLGLAKAQEVRDAIRAFRQKGKFVVAFADTFGELGPGTRPYYLATACNEIWLQPLGAVGLTGLRSEAPFFRGLFDRLGIKADFAHRREYKSATNSLTETAMTPPEREEVEALLVSMRGQIDRGIAADRKLTVAQVAELVDRAPLSDAEAKAGGLIDRIGYSDEALARARAHGGPGAQLISLSRYLERAGRPHQSGPTIALIYATGLITRDGGTTNPLLETTTIGADKLVKALREARRAGDVQAIVLRIDSPGGSAVASETIWREVQQARAGGKPVIVSMGDTAASGGYYIAAPANKIVAEPATLTGSIGVLAGKLVIGGLLQKLGITTDSVQRGANAGMFSEVDDFTPEGRDRLEAFLDVTYRGFKEHVAAGRHMSADAVETAARGRVWSGEDAKERGLVDELGGYAVALRLAKEAAHIPAEGSFKLAVYPREKNVAEVIADRLLGREPDENAGTSTLGRSLTAYRALAGAVAAVFGDQGVLRMPPIGEVR